MVGTINMRFDGGREIEKALAKLPRSTAKSVARRVIKKVLEPVRATADSYTDSFDIAITSKLSKRQRRLARGDFASHVVSMYVGPVKKDGSYEPHAHLMEFGTAPRWSGKGKPEFPHYQTPKYVGFVPPQPFMRPAWDAWSPTMLQELGRLMWIEIEKTVARRAKRAAKLAGK